MTEHIKMMLQEAKQKAEAIRRIILDTYHTAVNAAIGGHARMLAILGKALGVRPEEMIECD